MSNHVNRLLTELLNNILYEYTDEEKKAMGIPPEAQARGGKWYVGDEYAGKVVDGRFLPASPEEVEKEKLSKKTAPSRKKEPRKKKISSGKPVVQKMSGATDELSDYIAKQAILNGKISVGLGNNSSALSEIMSGVVFDYLQDSPDMDEESLVKQMYQDTKDTKLGKAVSSGERFVKSGHEYVGMDKKLTSVLRQTARSGRAKFKMTLEGVSSLVSQGLMTQPITHRNYSGHGESKNQIKKLIETTPGPFYTKFGVEIPKEELFELIESAGKGKNPSDTTTIATDNEGRSMVILHSDKIDMNATQGQVRPQVEMDKSIDFIKTSGLSEEDISKAEEVIRAAKIEFAKKENELKSSDDVESVRVESIDILRQLTNNLNQFEVTNIDGKKKPLGDWLQAKELVETLHIDVIDGEDSQGVGRFAGLFNLNMGGVVVETEQLKNCLGSQNSIDFTSNLQVEVPEGEEQYTKSKDGKITGRVIYVYAVDKAGQKFKVAKKVQRSSGGQDGKLNNLYVWEPDIKNCFKENQ
jgi:hypothetical protein